MERFLFTVHTLCKLTLPAASSHTHLGLALDQLMHQYLLCSFFYFPLFTSITVCKSSIGRLPPYDHNLDSKKKKKKPYPPNKPLATLV